MRQSFGSSVLETYSAQFDGCQQFKPRFFLDGFGEAVSMPQIFSDRLAKRREAVVAQRHPQLHGAESSRQLQRFFEKRIPLHRVCARGTSIVASMGERLSRPFGRPIEQTAAIERLIQPFVRV